MEHFSIGNSLLLFHTMDSFYVTYRYVFSKWRSISPVEINQYYITMATHYDITMGNNVARDAHCESYGITMHNDIIINLFIMYFLLNAKLCYSFMGSME